jgi:hypothetical protein
MRQSAAKRKGEHPHVDFQSTGKKYRLCHQIAANPALIRTAQQPIPNPTQTRRKSQTLAQIHRQHAPKPCLNATTAPAAAVSGSARPHRIAISRWWPPDRAGNRPPNTVLWREQIQKRKKIKTEHGSGRDRQTDGSARGGLHRRSTAGTCLSAAGADTGFAASGVVHAWGGGDEGGRHELWRGAELFVPV